MLECKNDPTRKYKGDEPSPKGLGWCAHAEKAGQRRAGRDKKTWTVTVDSNGRKAWRKGVKPAPRADSVQKARKPAKNSRSIVTYSLEDNSFSDGTLLTWQCHPDMAPSVVDQSVGPLPYASYKDITASDVDVELLVDSDGLALYTGTGGGHKIFVRGPFTVDDLFRALREHYRVPVGADEYDHLEGLFGHQTKDRRVSWSMKKIRSKIKTRGQTRQKWCVYAGCRRVKTWTEFFGRSVPVQSFAVEFGK